MKVVAPLVHYWNGGKMECWNKVENTLLKLIESLQKKQSDKQWEDSFNSK